MSETDYPEHEKLISILKGDQSRIIPEIPDNRLWDHIESQLSADRIKLTDDNLQKSVVNHSGKRRALFVAAAALLLLVGSFVYINSSDQNTELVALGEFRGSDSAEASNDSLSVKVSELDPIDDHFYELWLINFDESGAIVDLVSLGAISSDIKVDLDDIDTGVFSTVDISIEPDDENASHSGNSVLRGDIL